MADFKIKKYVASNFEYKNKQRVKFCIGKETMRQILNWNKYNVSDVELKKIQRVIFWLEKNNVSDFELKKNNASDFGTEKNTTSPISILKIKTRQIVKKIFALSDFELKILQRVRF